MPAFAGKQGEVKGVVMGVGNIEKSPIPKLDEQDNITGYWALEEVQRYATFGMARVQSALDMERQQQDFHHGRNAPHGANPNAINDANLSGLDETNLLNLTHTTGLSYQALSDTSVLSEAMSQRSMAVWQKSDTDMQPLFGLLAVLFIIAYFLPQSYLDSLFKRTQLRTSTLWLYFYFAIERANG